MINEICRFLLFLVCAISHSHFRPWGPPAALDILPQKAPGQKISFFSLFLQVKQERQEQRFSEGVFKPATLHVKAKVSKAVQDNITSDQTQTSQDKAEVLLLPLFTSCFSCIPGIHPSLEKQKPFKTLLWHFIQIV